MSEKPIPPKANSPAMDLLAWPAMTMATWRTVPTSDAMARARRFSMGVGGEVEGDELTCRRRAVLEDRTPCRFRKVPRRILYELWVQPHTSPLTALALCPCSSPRRC